MSFQHTEKVCGSSILFPGKFLHELGKNSTQYGCRWSGRGHYADSSHQKLRARRERPSGRAADQPDEISPFHGPSTA